MFNKKTDEEKAEKAALKAAGMGKLDISIRKSNFTSTRLGSAAYGVKMDKNGTVTDPNDRRNSGSIAGASAVVDTAQALGSRITATRLLATGVLALAIKKKTGEVFILIEGPDYAFTAGPIKANKADGARKWAKQFNEAAADAEQYGIPA